ncbi:bifunctional helix-turn-helix transcriptional regulator/GNAT family N-acetyltransferase [Rhizobium sp. 9140]|uniref:bifunctional helix-turn-helix transcriptional regulator/GNAT family N-acetyltransferase n=1 Tax=Rhizobium sp. 9140 TaxID=1761900 RepID=UPI000791F0E2|nr:bifunctional helix-turn-helix transcriptional regulator/GNAT family N-acetyltransferase [Rhizobium sp. 9140]CZT34826.1 transcriptional regulator, MarR family with acetyltransferase activity [Rhizobium sp. 9140]
MISRDIDETIRSIRDASRGLVRELGFLEPTLAGTDLAPSGVHALIEIEAHSAMTASVLCTLLGLEKSSVSRLVRKLVDAGEVREESSHGDGRSKCLSLTTKGQGTVAAIHAFATSQVSAALSRMEVADRLTVLTGLRTYTDALHAGRTDAPGIERPGITIESGYRSGIIGRSAEIHAAFYRRVGFGAYFEAQVAAGLAAFVQRLDKPVNGLWSAVESLRIVGTVAIDGEDLGAGLAHLRWFIVDDGQRGGGAGRRLLSEALSFCDRLGFRETHLWTFRGLDAARHLYEANGFVLDDEQPGRQWGEEVTEQRFVRKAISSAP